MPRVKRHPNHRLVKIHRNYTVEEIADLFKVHKNSVRLWIKAGLQQCDDKRPVLILGNDLANFLEARRAKNKRPCKIGEFYCLRCRIPKLPAYAAADCFPVNDKIGHLQGLCPDCTSIMNRRVNLAKLEPLWSILSITFRQASERISNRAKPSLNIDLDKGAQHD